MSTELETDLAAARERISALEAERAPGSLDLAECWEELDQGRKRERALEAERDKWRNARADLQTHHDYHLAKMTERIGVLEDTLNEIYHATDSTTHQMELINEVLPQRVTE